MIVWNKALAVVHQLENMHVSLSSPWDAMSYRRGAPYKPMMMLAVMDGMREAVFDDASLVVLNDWLQHRYAQYIALCDDALHNHPRIPFVHLSYEPFWRLVPCAPYAHVDTDWDLRSEKAFTQHIAGATLDWLLLRMIYDPQWYGILRYAIIQRYFVNDVARRCWSV